MRLIELEAAIKTACDAVEHYPSDWAVIEAAMRALPVVEERKHGHWIEINPKNGKGFYRCSVCGGVVCWLFGDGNYCQDCGAKMDEVAEDEVRQNK